MGSNGNGHHDHQLNKITLGGLIVTLGIIYGDIGTSPLYVLKAIVGAEPISAELVKGGISAIFYPPDQRLVWSRGLPPVRGR